MVYFFHATHSAFCSDCLRNAVCAGAWYWPFGTDEDDPSKPLRLHRLLEEANNYIEIAEDEAIKGHGEAALDNYRLALSELDRVERENPDRAETAEFSPLRNKRAACVAAMDAIRFAQVDENERAVAVTDTRELQKRWNKKHGIKDPEDEKKPDETKKAEVEKKPDAEKKPEDEKKPDEAKKTDETKKAPEPAAPTPLKAEPEKAPAKPPVKPPEKKPPESQPKQAATVPPAAPSAGFAARMKTALAEVRNKDYVAADLLLEDLMKEQPNNLNVLLLRAAAQSGMGSNYAARRTLEKAMRAHPKSYLPYYNLANLLLDMGESAADARQYYEMGRVCGGPVWEPLEKRLGKVKGEK